MLKRKYAPESPPHHIPTTLGPVSIETVILFAAEGQRPIIRGLASSCVKLFPQWCTNGANPLTATALLKHSKWLLRAQSPSLLRLHVGKMYARRNIQCHTSELEEFVVYLAGSAH